MSPLLKNIFVGIICIILFGFAYFFITGNNDGENGANTNEDAQAALVNKTQSFIERSRKLQEIFIDTTLFTNVAFTSLRSFATDVPNQPLGRNDIFGSAQKVGVNSSVATETEE